jgi:hypothetical protein
MALDLRAITPDDEDVALAALAQACRAHGSATGPDREEWLWRMGLNPAGVRAIGAFDGERLVGQFTAVPRKVWIAAREASFCEWRETFALERSPGLVREPLVQRLVEEALRAGAGEDLCLYGLPEGAAWRLANGRLGFEVVRNQTILVRPRGEVPVPDGLTIEPLARFDHQARWLWDRVCGAFGAGTIRDADHLNWRFVERPGVRYERLGVRDENGILRGVAVLRAGEWAGVHAVWMIDWIVPPEEPDVGRALLATACNLARKSGSGQLAAVLPDWSPWFDHFQCAGFRVRPSGRLLAARPGAKRFHEVWLRDQWWYTLGDFLEL